MIGRLLKQYQIVEAIGVGGMGEVYRAHDTKLDRDVALKVLPSGALADETARRRFRKEALALSRLSHPHVAALFDFDTTDDGVDFLVMELVTGPSLELKIRHGPLPEKDVVRIGGQLLRALVDAHEHGIIHRDLKPQNVRLTADGLVKVLDFGLARLVQAPSDEVTTGTASDVVAGTPPYMSPEQLLGKVVDARTDVYAAGVLLYEMAAGRRPFGEASGPHLVAKILSDTPPAPREVNPSLSPPLEQAILKATDRDPGLRYQSARELLIDLERLGGPNASAARTGNAGQGAAAGRRSKRRRWFVGTSVAIVAIVAVARLLHQPPPPRIRAFTRLAQGVYPAHGLSTDGHSLYFVSGRGSHHVLNVMSTEGGYPVTVALSGEGSDPIDYSARHNALLLRRGDEGELWMLPLPGGTPRRLGDIEIGSGGAAWSPDGARLAFTRGKALFLAGGDGSGPEKVADFGATLRGVLWAPNGHRLRLLAIGDSDPTPQITELDLGDDRHTLRAIAKARGYNAWSWPPGTWTRDGRYYLFADAESLSHGSRLLVRRETSLWPWTRPEVVSLDAGPNLWRFPIASSLEDRVFVVNQLVRGELIRLEGSSVWRSAFPQLGSADSLDFSRDVAWATWVAWPEGTLWRARTDGSEKLALTTRGEFDQVMLPRWSPDGRQVAFAGVKPGGLKGFFVAKADGGPAVSLVTGKEWGADVCWLADGHSLLGGSSDPARGIWRIDTDTHGVTMLDGSEGLSIPKCGPGGVVLASDQKDGLGSTHVLDLATGKWRRLPVDGRTLNFASFSRDGRSVYGIRVAPHKDKDVTRLELANLQARVVGRCDDEATGSAGAWFGLGPDDSPLFFADRTTFEIYALEMELP